MPRIEPLSLPEAWRSTGLARLAELGVDGARPFLIVHPGAGGAWKRWAAHGFTRVVRQAVVETGCHVLIHQGPADGAAAEALRRALAFDLACPVEPPLELLAVVLRAADAYLGGDSGVSHLAAAGAHGLSSCFRPATHARWAPWSPTALALEMPEGPTTWSRSREQSSRASRVRSRQKSSKEGVAHSVVR